MGVLPKLFTCYRAHANKSPWYPLLLSSPGVSLDLISVQPSPFLLSILPHLSAGAIRLLYFTLC